MKVAFIGLGNMGGPMARRVRAAHHDLVVHDQRREAARAVENDGARWASTIGEAVDGADVVCLSLPGPRQVEEVVLGPEGVLAHLRSGAVLVDHTTNALDTVYRVGRECAAAGVGFLDVPVSGGAAGATAGRLVAMIGGDTDHLGVARPVIDSFADTVLHFGEIGTGTVAKLVNNQLYLCGEVLFQEGLILAAKAGIEPAALLQMLDRTGVATTHVRTGARVLNREFDGDGFALALAEKDVAMALAAGRALDVPLATTSAAHLRFVEALAAGLGDKRSFATLMMIERAARFKLHEPIPRQSSLDFPLS
jgi:3-hydroxyisobutyrate dehydrogenase-like beta-hydroxyacid dehydrogenase